MSKQTNNPTPPRAMRRPGHHLTEAEREAIQEKFLKTLSMTANIRAACLAVGIDRSTVYYWQEHDDPFSLRFTIANQEANDMLLAAAWERGVKGVEKPVVSMGRQVFVTETVDGKEVAKPLMERVYSDSLLSLLMKARMPEFRDKQAVELTGKDGGAIKVDTTDYSKFTDDELALLEQLAQKVHNDTA